MHVFHTSIFSILWVLTGCNLKGQVLFLPTNFIESQKEIRPVHIDSLLTFVQYTLENKEEECKKLFPEITSIDVSIHMGNVKGFDPYLRGLGDFIDP